MRRMRIVLLLLLLVCLLAGCAAAGGGGAEENAAVPASPAAAGGTSAADRTVSAGAAVPAAQDAAVSAALSQERTVSAPLPLSDEEVLAAYDRAAAAYGWFTRNTLPADGEKVEVNGLSYQRVNYAGIDTLEDLRTYLRGLFSEDLVEQLAPEDGTQYLDVEGALYVHSLNREPDPQRGNVTKTVEQQSDDAYSVNVTVEVLDQDLTTVLGLDCYSFPYCRSGDRWVFTDFQPVD